MTSKPHATHNISNFSKRSFEESNFCIVFLQRSVRGNFSDVVSLFGGQGINNMIETNFRYRKKHWFSPTKQNFYCYHFSPRVYRPERISNKLCCSRTMSCIRGLQFWPNQSSSF